MAGDYTRFRYNPVKDTSGVLMQQGRVLLDQDWNEYVQAQERRWRAETIDIIGRAVVPTDAPGFELKFTGGVLTIGIGRMYVDGLLAENHGVDPTDPANRIYDPILAELVGKQPILYTQQPYLPNPDPLPTGSDPHVVYLDVWNREVTYLEDEGLIDQAVGVDTATRLQTVWQVKVLPDIAVVDCPSALPASLTSPSAGQLSTKAAGVPASTDPCIVPASGGYRGSGNRCYRVEIQNGGTMGGGTAATFKWSRDNASVASKVTAINAALDTMTVVLTKRDAVLRFQPNDWVEVTDDDRYFAGLPGEMRQVLSVDDVNLTIQLKTALPAGEFDATKPERHTRVIRWDQSGIVRDQLNNVIVDVDASGGLIPVPAPGTSVVLEDGIQITFAIDPAISSGAFKNLDYWMFSARVIDASVETLVKAPPAGIHHHYAKLGYINSTTVLGDCRIFWPPASGECCDCQACVTAASHNSGTFTLNMAINQVKGGGGGKVCLGPGVYKITEITRVDGAQHMDIVGHGMPVLQPDPKLGTGPIMSILRSEDISVFGVKFVGLKGGSDLSAVIIENSTLIQMQRCEFDDQETSTLSPAIGMTGFVISCEVSSCAFRVGTAIARLTDAITLVELLLVDNNVMICTGAAVDFTIPNNILLETRITRNTVLATMGFGLVPAGIDATIEDNTIVLSAGNARQPAAILCGLHQCRIANNRISSITQKFLSDPERDGIVLTSAIYGTQIVGNRITLLPGHGIFMVEDAIPQETIVDGNQMLSLRENGIFLQRQAVDLMIKNNSLAFVGLSPVHVTAGIQLRIVINLDVVGNFIESVGPTTGTPPTGRAGIDILIAGEARIAGNRIVDIGPPSGAAASFGIRIRAGIARLDLEGNEVRRALVPPKTEDTSPWFSVLVMLLGWATIRGNFMEGFGSIFPVAIFATNAFTFVDNQCFLDNPATTKQQVLVVVALTLGKLMVTSNFVVGPATGGLGGSAAPWMFLEAPSAANDMTVLGNIANQRIVAGNPIAPLLAPWDALNR